MDRSALVDQWILILVVLQLEAIGGQAVVVIGRNGKGSIFSITNSMLAWPCMYTFTPSTVSR